MIAYVLIGVHFSPQSTHCDNLERRDTTLLVKANMQEHIEKAFRQLCHEGEGLVLCLLKRLRSSRCLDLHQCVCANVPKPGGVLGIVSKQAAVLRVRCYPCLLRIPGKQPTERFERRAYPPVGRISSRHRIGRCGIPFQPLEPGMGLIRRGRRGLFVCFPALVLRVLHRQFQRWEERAVKGLLDRRSSALHRAFIRDQALL